MAQLDIYRANIDSHALYSNISSNNIERQGKRASNYLKIIKMTPDNEREERLDWRQQGERIGHDEVIKRPFIVVENYLKNNLKDFM